MVCAAVPSLAEPSDTSRADGVAGCPVPELTPPCQPGLFTIFLGRHRLLVVAALSPPSSGVTAWSWEPGGPAPTRGGSPHTWPVLGPSSAWCHFRRL